MMESKWELPVVRDYVLARVGAARYNAQVWTPEPLPRTAGIPLRGTGRSRFWVEGINHADLQQGGNEGFMTRPRQNIPKVSLKESAELFKPLGWCETSGYEEKYHRR
jgi:hypothetical protein